MVARAPRTVLNVLVIRLYFCSMNLSDLFPPPPPPAVDKPDMRVAFILSPRFSLLPFAGFIDSLRHAADEADYSRQVYCHWRIIGPSTDPVRASCGLATLPQEVFPDPGCFDYVVVVGGLLPDSMDHPEATIAYLRRAYRSGVSVVGLCTGSFVLARTGLLDGRRCAVHSEHAAQLRALFPRTRPVTDQVFVNEEEVITCPGGTAALDLAFAIIEARCGRARAVKGLASLLIERHRAAHDMPYRPFEPLRACGDRRVEQALAMMDRRLSNPLSIGRLAQKLGTTPRELNRAFARHAGESPAGVWRKLRLAHAHWLLLNSSKPSTQIALECGFADAAHFLRWFRREFGDTPSRFRSRHRQSRGTMV